MPENKLKELDDNDLMRYSRHLLLPEVDYTGQQKLLAAKILIIGAGGLGSAAALYLAASGIGEIVIADHDEVELNNLQRQIVHDESTLGQSKVTSAAEHMRRINSKISIIPLKAKLSGELLSTSVAAADIVLDCTDNLTSRFAINQACVEHKKWLVSAAAIRWEGQISVYHCGFEDSPCYHCFYGGREDKRQNCSNNGVISPVVGVMGSLQAIEVLKLIIDQGEVLLGRVLLFDALSMQWQSMQLPKNPRCAVCGNENL